MLENTLLSSVERMEGLDGVDGTDGFGEGFGEMVRRELMLLLFASCSSGERGKMGRRMTSHVLTRSPHYSRILLRPTTLQADRLRSVTHGFLRAVPLGPMTALFFAATDLATDACDLYYLFPVRAIHLVLFVIVVVLVRGILHVESLVVAKAASQSLASLAPHASSLLLLMQPKVNLKLGNDA